MVSRALEVLGDQRDGVYLVGGSSRDLLLGRNALEVDLAVEGDAVALAARVANEQGGELVAHDRFGTASVRIDGLQIDLASTRSESYPSPGALPTVTQSDLGQDLSRRDFSVNAIAIALAAGSIGRIECWPGALDDLEAKRLRVLHELSFTDDPTRILRMCRYAGRLGFEITESTSRLARRAVESGALSTLSQARIGAELTRSVSTSEPDSGIWLLCEYGLLEIVTGRSFDSERLIRACDLASDAAPTEEIRIASLFLGASTCLGVPDLQLPPRLGKIAAEAVRADELSRALAQPLSRPEISNLVRSHEPAVIASAAATSELGVTNARLWFAELSGVDCPISALELCEAGIPEGPAVGIGLRTAWDLVVDSPGVNHDAALAAAIDAARLFLLESK